MENPGEYSGANALQRADAEAIMREYCTNMKIGRGARVLDVGCGSGDVTAEIILPLLPTDEADIVGIDLSEQMINHARQKHPQPRLSFFQLDIEEVNSNLLEKLTTNFKSQNNNDGDDTELNRQSIEILINDVKLEEEQTENVKVLTKGCGSESALPRINEEVIIDNRFDLVLSFYCLHWIQNQRQALKNIYSMVKPGGHVILTLLAQSTIYTMYELVSTTSQWSNYMKDVCKFVSPYQKSPNPEEELMELAKETGFQVLHLQCRKRNYVYNQVTHLQEAIKAVNPFCSRLPEDLIDDYLRDCINIVQHFNLADITEQGYNVHYSLLVAHLTR